MHGNNVGIFDAERTVTEVLKNNGYETIAFNASNPFVGKSFGYDRGFDSFNDFLQPMQAGGGAMTFLREKTIKHKKLFGILRKIQRNFYNKPRSLFNSIRFKFKFSPPTVSSFFIKSKFLDWYKKREKKPFFAWLHFMDTHGPYDAGEKWRHFFDGNISRGDRIEIKKIPMERKKSEGIDKKDFLKMIALYDGSIKKVDEAIGSILKKLRNNGEYENTLIIITADHGEEFGEHGDYGHFAKLYDELLKVPLIIKFPGRDPKKVEFLSGLMDIPPTILSTLGIEIPASFRGKDLLKLMNKKEKPRRKIVSETLFSHYVSRDVPMPHRETREGGKPIISVRNKRWKCIYNSIKNRHHFFDLKKDPGEKEPVNPPYNIFQKFRKIISQHLRNSKKKPARGTNTPKMNKKEKKIIKKKLEELGYI